MSRVNDVGGQSGFGPVAVEPDEPPFHADWEARVYALNVAMLRRGVYNLDQFRDAIERMPPAEYLAASYYERWLHAVETLTASRAGLRAMAEPRFAVGDRVRTRSVDPSHHTRLPRYARGQVGEVVEVQGTWPLADDRARGLADPRVEPVYTVRFPAADLWGAAGRALGAGGAVGVLPGGSGMSGRHSTLGDRGAGAPAGGAADRRRADQRRRARRASSGRSLSGSPGERRAGRGPRLGRPRVPRAAAGRRERGARGAGPVDEHRAAGRSGSPSWRTPPTTHNVLVCTLCSCYPIGLLGPSPSWYKSEAYRSRVVREPRAVLAEFGLVLPEATEIVVHDTSAESRHMVLPRAPGGHRRSWARPSWPRWSPGRG